MDSLVSPSWEIVSSCSPLGQFQNISLVLHHLQCLPQSHQHHHHKRFRPAKTSSTLPTISTLRQRYKNLLTINMVMWRRPILSLRTNRKATLLKPMTVTRGTGFIPLMRMLTNFLHHSSIAPLLRLETCLSTLSNPNGRLTMDSLGHHQPIVKIFQSPFHRLI